MSLGYGVIFTRNVDRDVAARHTRAVGEKGLIKASLLEALQCPWQSVALHEQARYH